MSSSDITEDRSSSRTRPAKISAIRNGVGGGVHRADSKVYFWYRNEGKNVMDLDNQNVLWGSKHRNYFSKLTTCLNDSARPHKMLPVWVKTHDLSHNLKQVFFVLRDWSWTMKTSQAVWHCSAMLDRASSRGTAPRNNDALRMHWISRWDLLVNPKEVEEHMHKGPVRGRTQFISTDFGNTDFSMLWTLQYQLTENSRQYVT